MRKYISSLFILLLCLGCLAACGNNTAGAPDSMVQQDDSVQISEPTDESIDESAQDLFDGTIKTAFDGAAIQTEDSNRATRVIENGTKVNLRFGDDLVIPAMLNDSEAAQALIDALPYSVRVSKGRHDFCGYIDELFPYSEEEEHYGWLNGDIDFTTAHWFAIFYNDEAESDYDEGHVNLGVIDCELSVLEELSGSYDVTIELAE